MRRRSLAVVLLVFSALFLAACGDDGDEGSLEDQVEQSGDSGDSGGSDTTEAADSGDSGDGGDTDATSDVSEALDELDEATDDLGDAGDALDEMPGDLGDLGEGLEELDDMMDSGCLEFSLAYASVFLSGLGAFGGMSEEEVAQAQADLEELQASVPEELSEDFATVSEAYSSYFEELAGSTLAEMGELEDPMSDPDVAAADENINTWIEENCGG